MGVCHSDVDEQLLNKFQPLFDALQLRRSEVRRLYRLFAKVDVDHSGSISLRELMNHLEMGATVFRDRVFSIFDEDSSGQIDFREFVLSLWNYCTLSKATLDLFAFDLYDTDNNGELSSDEVKEMLHDLYGNEVATHPAAKVVAMELRQLELKVLDIAKFQAFAYNHPSLLFPAFQLQHALRQKILGVRFWERASERRIRLTDGRFLPIEQFMELNVNNSLFAATFGQISARRVDENARFVLANTGTLAYRRSSSMEENPGKEAPSSKSVGTLTSQVQTTPYGSPIKPVVALTSDQTLSSSPNKDVMFGVKRSSQKENKEEKNRQALDRVFQNLMKDQTNVPLHATSSDSAGHADGKPLPTKGSFALEHRPVHRNSIKPRPPDVGADSDVVDLKEKKRLERLRRHTVDSTANLISKKGEELRKAPRKDLRQQFQNALARKAAETALVVDLAVDDRYGRRPTLP
eukprot:gene8556-9429_t